ncbi:thioredoxin [Candidatus Geothermarchaeota archaeon ex4572_27]|nr:MAG: thioredoxin [Candidatus Geothermarchaeota archaeon ex4572_27]
MPGKNRLRPLTAYIKRLIRGESYSCKPGKQVVFEVSDHEFEEKVVKRSLTTPVIVDFYADWCFPCKMLSPVLEKVVSELCGRVVLAKVNVDSSPAIASMFGVMSVPTVVLIKRGKVADYFIGYRSEEEVKRWVLRHIEG